MFRYSIEFSIIVHIFLLFIGIYEYINYMKLPNHINSLIGLFVIFYGITIFLNIM